MPNRWICVFKILFLQIYECKVYLQNGLGCSKPLPRTIVHGRRKTPIARWFTQQKMRASQTNLRPVIKPPYSLPAIPLGGPKSPAHERHAHPSWDRASSQFSSLSPRPRPRPRPILVDPPRPTIGAGSKGKAARRGSSSWHGASGEHERRLHCEATVLSPSKL